MESRVLRRGGRGTDEIAEHRSEVRGGTRLRATRAAARDEALDGRRPAVDAMEFAERLGDRLARVVRGPLHDGDGVHALGVGARFRHEVDALDRPHADHAAPPRSTGGWFDPSTDCSRRRGIQRDGMTRRLLIHYTLDNL